jgi:hypothetical protein
MAGLAYGLIEAGGSLEVPVDLAVGLSDETGDDSKWKIVRSKWIRHPVGSQIDFKGTWGLDNNIRVFPLSDSKGEGPASPTAHAEWTRPGVAILCNRKWFAPSGAKPDDRACALISRQPLFRTRFGVYCSLAGPPNERALSCWRDSNGVVKVIGAGDGSRPSQANNRFAIGFHPSGYRIVASGTDFRVLCERVDALRLDNCHGAVGPRASEAARFVAFVCQVAHRVVTCSNHAGKGLTITK